jgi:hypothetical protein
MISVGLAKNKQNCLFKFVYFCQALQHELGKMGKVKTTAEELEEGIPAKLMYTQTGDTFLRFF